jgi:prepilin peptidase CpaA
MNTAIAFVLCAILTLAAVIDLRSRRIPNILTFPAAILALSFSFVSHGWDGLLFSVGGIGTGIGLLLIPYLLGGMGAGDAKLMGVVGGFLGAKGAVSAFLLIAVVGGIYAIALRVTHRKALNGFFKNFYLNLLVCFATKSSSSVLIDNPNSTEPRLCYGLAIALGTFAYLALNAAGIRFI